MPLQWRNQFWQSLDEGHVPEIDFRSVIVTLCLCSATRNETGIKMAHIAAHMNAGVVLVVTV